MQLRNYLTITALGACIGLFAIGALYQFARPFGATASLEELADLQGHTPDSVVLPFDIRYNLAFKIRRLETVKPDIAWFGSSRAGSAMASMFEPHTFYNMSFTGWTTEQLADAFEQSTRHVRPRVAIISLDYFLFTDRWDAQLRTSRQMILGEPIRYLRSSLGDFTRNAIKHWPVFEAHRLSPDRFIGTQAMLVHEGFRQDGSWQFTPAHIESAIRQYRNSQYLLDTIPLGQDVSRYQQAPIERLARIARERGIKLVAVQLPYLRVWVDFQDQRKADDEFYGVWHDFQSAKTQDWLRSLDIDFFDLAHSATSADQDNFIDGYHPSERGMQAMIDELMQNRDFNAVISGPPASAAQAP